MSDERPTVEVTDNITLQRYEGRVDGELAGILEYRVGEDHIAFTHAETKDGWEGKGIAGQIAKVALDTTIGLGKKIVPSCPYVRDYVGKHPEYDAFVA